MQRERIPLVYVSGQVVAPGEYRDLETGKLVRVCEPDELPEKVEIVRSARLFYRVEIESGEGAGAEAGEEREPALSC